MLIHLNQSLKKKCLICNKQFITYNWQVKHGFGRYCSRKCADLGRRKRKLFGCKKCGKQFEKWDKLTKFRNVVYCSWKCRYGRKKPKIKTIQFCIICNKKVISSSKRKYCSQECMSKGYGGKKNPCWRNGSSKIPYDYKFTDELKLFIRKRDKHKCQLCGKIVKGKNAHCHHIDRNKKNSISENLILLCNSCNAKMNLKKGYSKYKRIFKVIIKSYPEGVPHFHRDIWPPAEHYDNIKVDPATFEPIL